MYCTCCQYTHCGSVMCCRCSCFLLTTWHCIPMYAAACRRCVVHGSSQAASRTTCAETHMLQTIMLLPAAGVLSMGRHNDPNSGTSSFSFLLGSAPHLDMQYTIFG